MDEERVEELREEGTISEDEAKELLKESKTSRIKRYISDKSSNIIGYIGVFLLVVGIIYSVLLVAQPLGIFWFSLITYSGFILAAYLPFWLKNNDSYLLGFFSALFAAYFVYVVIFSYYLLEEHLLDLAVDYEPLLILLASLLCIVIAFYYKSKLTLIIPIWGSVFSFPKVWTEFNLDEGIGPYLGEDFSILMMAIIISLIVYLIASLGDKKIMRTLEWFSMLLILSFINLVGISVSILYMDTTSSLVSQSHTVPIISILVFSIFTGISYYYYKKNIINFMRFFPNTLIGIFIVLTLIVYSIPSPGASNSYLYLIVHFFFSIGILTSLIVLSYEEKLTGLYNVSVLSLFIYLGIIYFDLAYNTIGFIATSLVGGAILLISSYMLRKTEKSIGEMLKEVYEDIM